MMAASAYIGPMPSASERTFDSNTNSSGSDSPEKISSDFEWSIYRHHTPCNANESYISDSTIRVHTYPQKDKSSLPNCSGDQE